ncbi:MAG TPA: type II CAAX endopeptidase family protein [Anaerolineae bacterium]|nr:type II CAAX endopeptidase family protein [Anaerolineae bacterium]
MKNKSLSPNQQVTLFFLIAAAIAWSTIPIFNIVATRAGLPDGATLIDITESWQFDSLQTEPIIPPPILYLLTRLQDFAFTLAAIILILITAGPAGLQQLTTHLNPKTISLRWLLFALLFPLGLYSFAATLAILADPTILTQHTITPATLLATLISLNAGLLTYLFFRAGLGEEPGLRGFALPLLQNQYGPFKASAILGLAWAAWHLPVLISQNIINIIFFFILAITFSYLFTYTHNHANHNLWIVALLHAGINAGDRMLQTLLPQLSNYDWQLPAYILMLLATIILNIHWYRQLKVTQQGHSP